MHDIVGVLGWKRGYRTIARVGRVNRDRLREMAKFVLDRLGLWALVAPPMAETAHSR